MLELGIQKVEVADSGHQVWILELGQGWPRCWTENWLKSSERKEDWNEVRYDGQFDCKASIVLEQDTHWRGDRDLNT